MEVVEVTEHCHKHQVALVPLWVVSYLDHFWAQERSTYELHHVEEFVYHHEPDAHFCPAVQATYGHDVVLVWYQFWTYLDRDGVGLAFSARSCENGSGVCIGFDLFDVLYREWYSHVSINQFHQLAVEQIVVKFVQKCVEAVWADTHRRAEQIIAVGRRDELEIFLQEPVRGFLFLCIRALVRVPHL